MRKIVSFLLIAVFLILPVSAASSSGTDVEYIQKSSFWNWLAGKPGTDWNKFVGYTFGNSCPNSEDGYHHASSYERPIGNWTVESGYYKCICDLCGAEFKAYEKDLQQSYDAQVAELPATGYTSDDSLLFTLEHKRMGISWQSTGYACNHDSGGSASTLKATFNCDSNAFSVVPASGYTSIPGLRTLYVGFESIAPISGFYARIKGTPQCKYTLVALDGTSTQDSLVYEGNTGLGVRYEAGALISHSALKEFLGITVASAQFQGFSPVYKVTPDISLSDTTYNITSRPTSITGDYGIIGDNGQIIKVEGDKIVNETNNTYYNPATGETTTITDWSYNYEDRSYTVTTESGDTVTITYGDEHVTIKEGDTTYNVYYLVNGSGSENPDPGPGPDVCDHTWTETSRTDSTCSTPGKVTSTCSKCNQTKTETIPATGHSWVVDRTVQTTYDEEGNLLQQGYTIYSCSVCGEQYKDMEGTGPPGPEEEKSIWEKLGDLIGSGFGGIIEIIEAILGKILDALTSLVDMITDKFKGIVESILSIMDELPALFGGFLDFLAAIFPFLPPEITTILTFGVIAITFIGILKAVRR